MFKKSLVSMSLIAMLCLPTISFAAEECKEDKDCKGGMVCKMATHQCIEPQPAGADCKRDVTCASKKCDVPEGKERGTCK